MSTQNQNLPDNPQIQVIKSGKTGLFTNYIYKAIPLAFDESMSYYETLCGLLHYLKNVIIPTVNNNADAVAELQDLYEKLRTYVDNYFTNLDVQEEINNKLDKMVEDGTLPEIIASYLNSKAVFGFDNVESMKNSTNLINGSYAETLGYYNKNDGGNALYKIRNITNEDIVDNMFIIALNNNNLIAELIFNDEVEIKQLGAKANNTDDDSDYLINAISKCNKIIINDGTYYINKTININKDNVTIQAKSYRNSVLSFGDNGNINFQGTSIVNSGTQRKFLTIENLELVNHNWNTTRITPFLNLICCAYVKIINCWISGKGKQVLMWECFDSRVLNTDFEWGGSSEDSSIYGFELRSQNGGNSSLPTYEYTNNIYFQGCRFESHIGTCVATSGQHTNKIIFESCKFESFNCLNQRALYFNNMESLYITDCVLAGDIGNTKNYLYIDNTTDFNVKGYCEHASHNSLTYSGEPLLYVSGSGNRTVDIQLNNHNAYTIDYKNFGLDAWDNNIFINGNIHVNNFSNKDLIITDRTANVATLTDGNTSLSYTVLENGFIYVSAVGTTGQTTPQFITLKNNTNNTELRLMTIDGNYITGFLPVTKGDDITCTRNTMATVYISIKYNRGYNLS